MVLVHSLRGDLQFILSAKNVPPLPLRVWSGLTEEVREHSGRDYLPESSGRPLDVVPGGGLGKDGRGLDNVPYRL